MIAKLALLHGLKVVGAFALWRRLNSRAIRILCYHGIWLGRDGFAGDSMFMSAATFDGRLRALRRLGYRVVTLESAMDALRGAAEAGRDRVVITIDDGWYSTFRHMLPALQGHAMPATLYCDTAHLQRGLPIAHVMARYLASLNAERWTDELAPLLSVAKDLDASPKDRLAATLRLAKELGADGQSYLEKRVFGYMTPDELRAAHRSGLDIQLHTHNHTLGDMTAAFIEREVEQNRQALASLLGCDPQAFRHFCYPSGRCSFAAAETLGKAGLASSTTTAPGLANAASPPHLLPRFVDGENVSSIEFEAELCGLMSSLRPLAAWLARRTSPP